MNNYIYIFCGVLSAALVILVYIMIKMRKDTSIEVIKKKLEDENKKLIEEKLKVEQANNERLKRLTQELNNKLLEINEWYINQQELISDESKKEFELYIADATLAGFELDNLIGIRRTGSSSEDDITGKSVVSGQSDNKKGSGGSI